jgi:hypothetical protein
MTFCGAFHGARAWRVSDGACPGADLSRNSPGAMPLRRQGHGVDCTTPPPARMHRPGSGGACGSWLTDYDRESARLFVRVSLSCPGMTGNCIGFVPEARGCGGRTNPTTVRSLFMKKSGRPQKDRPLVSRHRTPPWNDAAHRFVGSQRGLLATEKRVVSLGVRLR